MLYWKKIHLFAYLLPAALSFFSSLVLQILQHLMHQQVKSSFFSGSPSVFVNQIPLKSYNHFHHILKLFNVSRVTKRLATYNLRELGNIWKVSKLHRTIA